MRKRVGDDLIEAMGDAVAHAKGEVELPTRIVCAPEEVDVGFNKETVMLLQSFENNATVFAHARSEEARKMLLKFAVQLADDLYAVKIEERPNEDPCLAISAKKIIL